MVKVTIFFKSMSNFKLQMSKECQMPLLTLPLSPRGEGGGEGNFQVLLLSVPIGDGGNPSP
jgi:hypothetical protein